MDVQACHPTLLSVIIDHTRLYESRMLDQRNGDCGTKEDPRES